MGRRLHLRVEAQLPTYSGCTDCGYTRRLQVEAQLEHPVVVAEQRGAHVRVGEPLVEVRVELLLGITPSCIRSGRRR